MSAAAVSHGSMTDTISEHPQVSQTGPFSGGKNAAVPSSNVKVQENKDHMFLFKPGVTLDQIVQAMNEVGAGPSDVVAILEALRAAGALNAQLIVI